MVHRALVAENYALNVLSVLARTFIDTASKTVLLVSDKKHFPTHAHNSLSQNLNTIHLTLLVHEAIFQRPQRSEKRAYRSRGPGQSRRAFPTSAANRARGRDSLLFVRPPGRLS